MGRCRHIDCKDAALSLSEYCWAHTDDKEEYKKSLTGHIKRHASTKGFSLRHLVFPRAQWQHIDAEEVDLTGADLSGAELTATSLKRANLTGTSFKNANLASVDFDGAHLMRSDLSGASLWHAVFKDTHLVEANLQGADLLKAEFCRVKLWHARLENAQHLSRHSFIGKRPIDERGALSASETYRNLKQYFISAGRYDDASWASFKQMQLERKSLLQNRKIAYIPSLLMGALCGYGEKPYRVIFSSLLMVILYAITFFSLGILKTPPDIGTGALKFWDYLYFSIITFTTVGFGDLTPKLIPLFQLLAGSEAFIGAFMMGLFVFTLARRYTGR